MYFKIISLLNVLFYENDINKVEDKPDEWNQNAFLVQWFYSLFYYTPANLEHKRKKQLM